MSYNKRVDLILEKLASVKIVKREFHPRNFEFSARFVREFRREVQRLRKEGTPEKLILQKICKALRFYL